MRFLIDENVSADAATALRSAGHEVLTASEAGLCAHADKEVFRRAVSEVRILVTRDRHFTNPVRFPLQDTPGVFFIRHGNRTGQEEAKLVLLSASQLWPQDFANTLISIGTAGITRR